MGLDGAVSVVGAAEDIAEGIAGDAEVVGDAQVAGVAEDVWVAGDAGDTWVAADAGGSWVAGDILPAAGSQAASAGDRSGAQVEAEAASEINYCDLFLTKQMRNVRE